MNDITPKESIANLNHLYGMVSPDIQRSLDVAIKALDFKEEITRMVNMGVYPEAIVEWVRGSEEDE